MPNRSTVARALAPTLLASMAGAAAAVPPLPFPPTLNLTFLNGDNGFVITGVDALDRSGGPVSGAGDVNGDGIDDLIIGARGADPNGQASAGKSHVVFGRSTGFAASLDLQLISGSTGFVINGIEAFDTSGFSVSSAGDVNGDGIDDLIIGAVGASPDGRFGAGESYVVFGRDTSVDGLFPVSFDLSTLNGTNGFVINGIAANDISGWSVSSAGDINGDGIDDLIIGARLADPNGVYAAGESYVVFGGAGVGATGSINLSALNGASGFVIQGIDMGDEIGWSVSSAGDVNGDGVDDLIIGALHADQNGQYSAGESYVVFGKDTAVDGPFPASFSLSALNGANGFACLGLDQNDLSGFAVSSAGDVNGDGIDDLIIGAPDADPSGRVNAGESYVVFGKDTALHGAFPAALSLSTLNGTTGFVCNGIDASDHSGFSVASAGDVNGDGIGDIIIGARYADPNGSANAGESYVVFGKDTAVDGPFPASFNLSTLNGSNGFVLTGIDAGDESGISVSSAGDVNGDGADDLIIGAPSADPNGRNQSGESYIVFGRAPAPVCAGDTNGDGATNVGDFVYLAGNFGASVTPNTSGDLNGDGLVNASDFVILASDFGCGN